MQKFGFITLLGETNSGKSTLVNTMVGAKVSIVSHKVQTTRKKILGIYTDTTSQIVFIDTPGVFKAKRKLDDMMVSTAYGSITSADTILLVVDVQKGITEQLQNIIKRIKQNNTKNVILVLNKIDLIDKLQLLTIAEELSKHGIFQKTFMISALKNKGVNELLNYLLNTLPTANWLFNQDDISNASLRFMAAEITREKIYKYLHQELPYMIMVAPEAWEEKSKSIIIKQVINVTSSSHKKIVIGSSGETIKRISIEARKELEDMFDKKIHLYLFVKVKENLFEDNSLNELMSIE
ncbi:GTPase Era [Rickettsiales bacterium LUAb2]